jgi:hypothetical protein
MGCGNYQMGKRNFLMKKIVLSLLLLLPDIFLSAQENALKQVLKSWFRVHPFDMRFSSFITSLQKDPWFTVENYNRRTDSTFFFLSGAYKNFNPFRYEAKEIKLVVAEEEFIHADPLKTKDTIINLQLMGVTDTCKLNQLTVQKEFKRFHRMYAGRFWQSSHHDLQESNGISGEVCNYFVFPFTISPLASACGPVPETSQYTFTITLRFKVRQNIADLIISPEGL